MFDAGKNLPACSSVARILHLDRHCHVLGIVQIDQQLILERAGSGLAVGAVKSCLNGGRCRHRKLEVFSRDPGRLRLFQSSLRNLGSLTTGDLGARIFSVKSLLRLSGKRWKKVKAVTLVMLQPPAPAREPSAWTHAPSQPLMRSPLSRSQTPTTPRRAVGFFRSGCSSGCPAELITQPTSDRQKFN
jgi:hypothetical protein